VVSATAEEMPLFQRGQLIGPYQVQEPLGQGSTAVVYRARHAFLERAVALKVMPAAEDPAVMERFLDEARLLSRLSHPGLVHISDCGYLPQGGAFLAMELLEGELLQKRMQRLARLPLAEMVDIVRQLADALEVVHDAGLVHRDIKPSNIVLVKDEGQMRVKLLDFGVAKRTDGKGRTLPGMLLGTPFYMAPEQCRGQLSIDRRADVYALGAMLFQMATGRPPFNGNSVAEVLESHLLHTPPPLTRLAPELPPAVSEVVARALAKSPDDRFSCALGMAHALADAAHTRRGRSTAPMHTPQDPNPTIPHKAVAAVLPRPTLPMMRLGATPARTFAVTFGLAAALGVALLLGFWTLTHREPSPPVAPPPARAEARPEARPVLEVVDGDDEELPKPTRPRRHRPAEAAPPPAAVPPARAASPPPELKDPFDDP
jgi:serine/threonine-protein kinase